MTTTMTRRTDIHRPSAPEFDPEAYEFFGCFDLNPDPMWGGAEIHARRELVSSLVKQGWKFTSVHGSGQCGHCGARIRYAALMGHTATKGLIYVGETCLDNRFELTKSEFDRLRKEASLNRERSRKADRIAALIEEHPVLVWASYARNIEVAGGVIVYLDFDHNEFVTPEEAVASGVAKYHDIEDYGVDYKRGTTWAEQTRQNRTCETLSDIWYKVERYAEVSDKQAAYVERLVGWLTEAEEKRVQREAEKQALVTSGAHVPTGRVTVEGVVVSIKAQDSQWGTTIKMLVQTDEGWKVWGSLPDSIWEADKGTRVRFTATVEASKDDKLFGFFKRPTKAEIVEA